MHRSTRRAEKFAIRLLGSLTLSIIALGALMAVAVAFHYH
jgi:hypothetical protein